MLAVVLLLSFVQAATEFLPVSSSGHLVLLHNIVDLGEIDSFRFDVAIHLGTLIAVVLYFARDLLRLCKGWVRSLGGVPSSDGRLAWLLLLGTVPPVLIGLAVEPYVQESVRSPLVVASALALGAILLFLADRRAAAREMEDVRWRDALLIGASQAVAFIPGVSRSGMTIITARWLNMKRAAATRFSFLLAVPVTAAAAAKELWALTTGPALNRQEASALLFGIVATTVFGLVVIHVFLRFVSRHTFTPFVVYRLALALVVFAMLAF